MTAEKQVAYAPFMRNYEAVRRAERWGNGDGAYYRALPYEDLSGQHPGIWRIRARSFEALLRGVVRPMAKARRRPLLILDAGAGNGWLSYRLSLEGHRLLAIDLCINAFDGLGACSWYMDDVSFVVAQAVFEQAPLCDDQFDLVVFNGSIHYATSYQSPLREALRVLRPDGEVVILDSPLYEKVQSGQQMASERNASLRKRHGIEPTTLAHENYLTRDRLRELGRELGIEWHLHEPFYGWAWWLAPWLARLRRRREPARFYVVQGALH